MRRSDKSDSPSVTVRYFTNSVSVSAAILVNTLRNAVVMIITPEHNAVRNQMIS